MDNEPGSLVRQALADRQPRHTQTRLMRLADGPLLLMLALTLGGCASQVQSAEPERTRPSDTPHTRATGNAPLPGVNYAGLQAAAQTQPVALLDRLTWGAAPSSLALLQRLGAARYLEAQLHPQAYPPLPPEVQAQLAAMAINQAPLTELMPPLVEGERAIRRNASLDADQKQAALKAVFQRKNRLTLEAASQQLLYAEYSPNQLQEQMAWFWMNHFNVFRGGNIGPTMGDYYARVIKPHALGHFRDLLAATVFSPQMLLYLNNAQNARGHVNENYAREIMELHTLGVGSGYTQADVQNLARVLTGLGVDLPDRPIHVRPALREELWRDGLVVFNPARHDPDPKTVLGHRLAGRGVDEIRQVISLLADNPATARHVSSQLAQYFVADAPPPQLIDAMVRTWERTHGDIADVLRTLFTSPAFTASLGKGFKDPMHYVISTVRLSTAGRVISNPLPMLYWLDRLGEPLYGRQTPDGYPLSATAWDSPGQMTERFEIARFGAAGAPGLYKTPGEKTAPRALPPQLESMPIVQADLAQAGPATRLALRQAANTVQWNALFLSSPEFMQR